MVAEEPLGGSMVADLGGFRAADGVVHFPAPPAGAPVWLRDRALGNKDAGAAAWAIYLAGLAEGCRQSAT